MFALIALVAPVCAGELPAAGGFVVRRPAAGAPESHAWLLTESDGDPVLLHVPPRGEVHLGGGHRIATASGTVRLASRLRQWPEAIAAWDRNVYLAFPPADERAGSRLILTTAAAPVGGMWLPKVETRLEALPSLRGDGRLRGFVGFDRGLAALVEVEPGSHMLHILEGRAWREAPLPPGVEDRELSLVGLPAGVGLFARGGGSAELWTTALSTGAPAWTSEAYADPGAIEGIASIAFIDGELVLTSRGPGRRVVIRAVGRTGVREVARFEEIHGDYAAAPLHQSARLVLLWAERSPATPGAAPETASRRVRHQVLEVSVATGRAWFRGTPSEFWPFSTIEFRLLAILLVATAAAALLFVLRPDDDGVVHLPPGTALAEPSRRIVAGGIDLAIAWAVVSATMGVSLSDLWDPHGMRRLVSALIATIAVGFLLSTIMEWLFARSPGKMLAGCEVVRVGVTGDQGPGGEPPRPPSLRSAALRNAPKWLVPPMAMAGILSLGRRHRGDVLSRTAVVIRTIAPEDEPG